jgi:hypothetical protein
MVIGLLILYINSLSPWSVGWLGVLLAFSTAEPARPITDHRLAFSMAEPARTDGRTDGHTNGFSSGKRRGRSLSFLWFFALHLGSSGFLLCAWVPKTILLRRTTFWEHFLWQNRPEREITDHRLPATQVLRARSWEPNAATRQQQKKGAASVCLSPETQLSRLLIGLAWLLKLGFLGRYQYIKNLLKKRRRRY